MGRKPLLLIIGTVGILLVAVLTVALLQNVKKTGTIFLQEASLVDEATLAQLPQKDASTADLSRIAGDLIPPTNSWISGLALQKTSLAVYPMPLSFQASDTGFQVGLPTVTSDAVTITGGHVPGIEASINGATSFQLTRFDKTSASLIYREDKSDLGKVTIAQGSPYVFYRGLGDSTLTFANVSGGKKDGDRYQFTKGGKQYVVSAHDNAKLSLSGSLLTATVPLGGLLSMYAQPTDTDATLDELSGNELSSVAVTYETKDNLSLTRFEYETVNNKPTIMTMMPYQTVAGGNELSLVYQSIYGNMKSYSGNIIKTSVPLVTPTHTLDVSQLSAEEKSRVISDLQADSQEVTIEAEDSYFAGKQLARIATLLDIAEQLDQDVESQQLKATLSRELTKRLGGDYFYYDSKLKGIAAQTAAFGSEDFNDHHFHYGYFIYAASILGKYDTSFVDEYKDDINLLVADIASYEDYDSFPLQRTYDPYSAHSWAAGLAPFQDGNNQESSSEALNAWNGVALWADIIGNDSLKESSQWMLSNETVTAAKAWRNVDTSASYLSRYSSPVASLSFGGKRTYSTFFSNESNTKLGIQLIPMSPVMQLFKEDGGAIKKKIAAQDKPGNYNVALGDYLLMYAALSDKNAALAALDRQTDEFIDDGNSRTYLRAWIYAQD